MYLKYALFGAIFIIFLDAFIVLMFNYYYGPEYLCPKKLIKKPEKMHFDLQKEL